MHILIGDGSNYVSIVECPEEICQTFHTYMSDFIDSDQYCHNWGAEDLIRYINRVKPPHLGNLKMIQPYTDQYDEDCPRFDI